MQPELINELFSSGYDREAHKKQQTKKRWEVLAKDAFRRIYYKMPPKELEIILSIDAGDICLAVELMLFIGHLSTSG